MKKHLIPFLLLFAIAASSHAKAGEASEKAWSLLNDNKFEEAEKAFAAIPDKDGYARLDALQGLIACATIKGEFKKVFDLETEQVRTSSAMKDGVGAYFLRKTSVFAHATHNRDALVELYKEIYASPATDPEVKVIAARGIFNNLIFKTRFDEAMEYRSAIPFVKKYAALIGPFRDETGYEKDKQYAPEKNPGLEQYEDGTKYETRTVKNVEASKLYLSADAYYLLPDTVSPHAFYAFVLIKSEAKQKAILDLNATGGMRAWLKGMPIFDSEQFRGDYRAPSRSMEINLDAGLNPLIVKMPSVRSIDMSIYCEDGGMPKGISYADYSAAEFAKYPCLNIAGFVNSSPRTPRELAAIEKLRGYDNARSIWLLKAYEDNSMIDEARALIDKIDGEHGKSVYHLMREISFLGRQMHKGIDSASRIKKEETDACNRLLEIDGNNYIALMSAASRAKESQQTERAAELLKKAAAAYPQLDIVHRQLGDLYQDKNWGVLAEEEYKKAAELDPENEHLIADFYSAGGRLKEAKDLRDKIKARDGKTVWDEINELWDDKKYDEALARYKELFEKGYLDKKAYDNYRKSACNEKGEWEKVAEMELADYGKHPESLEAARTLAELYLDKGEKEKAVEWFNKLYARQLELDKGDPETLRRIRKLGGKEWDLEQHDIKLADIDYNAVRKEDHPEANHAVVLRLVTRRIFPDLSSESFIHTAIKVFDRSGIGQLSELNLPKNTDNLIYCHTIQPDGTVYVPTTLDNMSFNKATSMYKVTPGAVLEYAYRDFSSGEGGGKYFNDSFAAEQFSIPVIRGRYCLIMPKEVAQKLSIKVVPDNLAPVVTEENGEVVMTWDIKDVKGKKPEAFLPRDGELLSSISVNLTEENWAGYSRFLRRPDPIRSNAQIDSAAVEITRGLKSDEEKAYRIHAWISANIKDNGNSRTPRDVFIMKSGSTQSKALLAQAMLKAIGLKSDFVMVNQSFSNSGNGSRKDRRRSVGAYYNTNLLRIALPEDRDLWLRFMNPGRSYRPGDLGMNMVGSFAIESDDAGFTMLRVKGEELELGAEKNIDVALAEDGSASASGVLICRGAAAGSLRTATEDPQRGPLLANNIAASFFPKIKLSSSSFPESEKLDADKMPAHEPFILRFRGVVDSFCQAENGGFSFSPFRKPLGATYFMKPLPRENDFEIGNDYVQFERITYTAPEGWAFLDLPEDCSISCEYGLFISDINVEGRKLTASRLLILPSARLEPKEYEKLNLFLRDVDESEKATVKLEALPASFTENMSTSYYDGANRKIDTSRYEVREWPEGLALPEGGDAKK
ncbi:MAG: DUF3857 domain-containing protein [Planctomycetes bacterium]|nr:DUF3857 domain-containing protein [Planctomycetota bacterium]